MGIDDRMILQTPRLSLRPLDASDWDAMHELMSDAEVMAFWDVAEIDDPTLTRQIINSHLLAMRSGEALSWAIIRTSDQAFVGCCDLSSIDRWHHRADIGFITGKPFWGEGLTHEATRAVIDYAAQQLRLKRLCARTHLGNARSVRLLLKLGFAEEGVLRGHVQRGGERRDCALFGLLL